MKFFFSVFFAVLLATSPAAHVGLEAIEASMQSYALESAKSIYLFTFFVSSAAFGFVLGSHFWLFFFILLFIYAPLDLIFNFIETSRLRAICTSAIHNEDELEEFDQLDLEIFNRSVKIGFFKSIFIPFMFFEVIHRLVIREPIDVRSIIGEDDEVKYLLSDRFIPRFD